MGTVQLTSHCSVNHQWLRILGVLRLLRHPSMDPHPFCAPFAASVSLVSSVYCVRILALMSSVCCVIPQWILILRVLRLLRHPSMDPWCLPFAASFVSGSSSFVCSVWCGIHHWILGAFRLLLHPSVDPHPSVLRLLCHPLVDPWCLPFAAPSVSGSSFFVCFVSCVIHQWILRAFRLLLHPSVDP